MRRVPVLVIAFLALLLLLPLASAAPPIPVPNPDPNSQGALDAQGYSSATVRAEEETVVMQWNATFAAGNPGGPWTLVDQHQALTNWLKGSVHYIRATTYVNRTHGCSGVNGQTCPGYYAANGVKSASFGNAQLYYTFSSNDALNFYVNFSSLNVLQFEPEWSVTRMITFVATANQTWIAQGRNDLGYAILTSYG